MSMYGRYKPGDKAWPTTDCSADERKTVQADRDEADINKIVQRMEKNGQMPPMAKGQPFYGDVSEFGDLADCLIKIQEADELFMSYPAQLRERFDNDKVKFVEFLSDSRNREEAVSLGLIQKAPEAPSGKPPTPPPPKEGSV